MTPPFKFKEPTLVCPDCGRTVERRSGNQKRCDECRATGQKRQTHDWYTRNADAQRARRRAVYAADRDTISRRRRELRAADPERHREYHQAWRVANAPKLRLQAKCRTFQITMDELLALLDRQEGLCAICGRPIDVANAIFTLDHDHATNRIRGAVHKQCNTAIGLLGDDPDLLQRAADYLRAFTAPCSSA